METLISGRLRLVAVLLSAVLLAGMCRAAEDVLIPVGAARVEISPTNAVRLMGYAARAQSPAPTQILQPIYARALAIGADPEAALLITLDNCILPAAVAEDIRTRLATGLHLAPERIALTVTHTHSAPCLSGAAPNIFAVDIAPADQEAVDAYTRFLVGRVQEAAASALKDRQPARLAWGQGAARFAKNRRTAGGPVDHDLPLLRATSPEGRLRAVLVSYACHCTTLGGEVNATHGDWAGTAALALEREAPGVVALVAIGCGADSNPDPRGTVELVERHGAAIAAEARRLLALPLTPLTAAPSCRLKIIPLPFQTHFTRAQWEQRATNSGIVGHHARKWLARLDAGTPLPESLPYPVQTWAFGDQLAMVFLGGEVVVDYSLRLKRELDPDRVWINAYANDVPCYIPSRRILGEGGYEAESSLWYYDRPQQLSPDIEDQILGTVRDLLPAGYRLDPRDAERPPARSPEKSRGAFRVAPGFRVDLAAAEPLLDSPVAMDFATDGSVWVCEMRDYPSGLGGDGIAGGQVKRLRDDTADGRLDRAEVIAGALPFPTGLMTWRDGVLVCAAPDVWWIHPRHPGDPESAVGCQPAAGWTAERLLSGFATHNFQARVNGLRWGLDGWVHGSGGIFGGKVTVIRTGQIVDCQNRDFRFRPDTGEFEALAGVSQQGRARDDFDEWFGNDNSTLLWHFPLPDRYARRNPHGAGAGARQVLRGEGDAARLFPASRTLERFNDPHTANRLTSACGPEIYRDVLLGESLHGNAFICEPVHNLIRRAVLEADGPTFRERRAPEEVAAEFLASTDSWFRPVEVRTGPDGALWVVDFHRFVVEHPRWIPEDRLRELDVRAGEGTGRLWRIVSVDAPTRPLRDLTRLNPDDWVALLGSTNGVERDLTHRLLLERADTMPGLKDRVRQGVPRAQNAEGRAQFLSVLGGWNALDVGMLAPAWSEAHPRLRRFAVRLAETLPDRSIAPAPLLALAGDPDPGVRFQLALTLGEFSDPAAARTLSRIAAADGTNGWIRAAVLSSVLASPVSFADEFAAASRSGQTHAELRRAVVDSLIAAEADAALARWLRRSFPADAALDTTAQAEALHLLARPATRPELMDRLGAASDPEAAGALAGLQESLGATATALAHDPATPDGVRVGAIALLGEKARSDPDRSGDLLRLLDADASPAVRLAVAAALRRQTSPRLPAAILEGWSARGPGQRAALLDILLSRDAWAEALLSAVQQGEVTPAEISPAQRQQLRASSREAVRDAAHRLWPAVESDRGAVLARFEPVPRLTGNPESGEAHFERLCSSCHQVRGLGHPVGPDLAAFRAKPAPDFLAAILDPNAAIEPRYRAWSIGLKDGRSLTGVVQDESCSGLTVVQSAGLRERVPRLDIAELTPAERSLMPEGLEADLTPEQLADLIAWLRWSPGTFGGAGVEQITASRRRFRSGDPIQPTDLGANFAPLPYPSWLGSLPMHFCRATDGQSFVRWRVPVRERWQFPAAMGFASSPAARFALRVNDREALEFDLSLDGARWSREDGGVALSYRVSEHSAEDSNGVLEIALSPEWAGTGDTVTFEVRGAPAGSQRWFGLYDVRSLIEAP
ncbi:MAG: neutral/alkaline non-lysosomal ceramidase N-terminal domain-containing protein [Verrucomicrobia bacterium]|nr:neutral/alkaline non-lysosomal ceramidase N-terminal domain-containing protein [Verrucomicrobiota bacterium]